jgi:streptogramin lyase
VLAHLWRRGGCVASSVLMLLVIACGSVSEGSLTPAWRAVDLPGLTSALRAAAYDSTRDCLWIMGRQLEQDGIPVVVLTRLDVASGSVSGTPLRLPGDGYIVGTVAVDRRADVWLGWGTTLARYDPVGRSFQTWRVPNPPGPIQQSASPGLDGNMVALAVDPAGEIWVVSYRVRVILGFNTATNSWDRNIPLSLDPYRGTRLALRPSGQLVLNGWDGNASPLRPSLETINLANGSERPFGLHAMDYAVGDDGSLIYVDDSGTFGKVTLSGGSAEYIPVTVPIAPTPLFTIDGTGNIWFSMLGHHLVGVGELNAASGAVQEYPFPQPPTVTNGPEPACPPDVSSTCSSAHPTFNPEIQAIQVDGHGNIWVVTRVSGSGDPNSFIGTSPVYELKLTA